MVRKYQRPLRRGRYDDRRLRSNETQLRNRVHSHFGNAFSQAIGAWAASKDKVDGEAISAMDRVMKRSASTADLRNLRSEKQRKEFVEQVLKKQHPELEGYAAPDYKTGRGYEIVSAEYGRRTLSFAQRLPKIPKAPKSDKHFGEVEQILQKDGVKRRKEGEPIVLEDLQVVADVESNKEIYNRTLVSSLRSLGVTNKEDADEFIKSSSSSFGPQLDVSIITAMALDRVRKGQYSAKGEGERRATAGNTAEAVNYLLNDPFIKSKLSEEQREAITKRVAAAYKSHSELFEAAKKNADAQNEKRFRDTFSYASGLMTQLREAPTPQLLKRARDLERVFPTFASPERQQKLQSLVTPVIREARDEIVGDITNEFMDGRISRLQYEKKLQDLAESNVITADGYRDAKKILDISEGALNRLLLQVRETTEIDPDLKLTAGQLTALKGAISGHYLRARESLVAEYGSMTGKGRDDSERAVETMSVQLGLMEVVRQDAGFTRREMLQTIENGFMSKEVAKKTSAALTRIFDRMSKATDVHDLSMASKSKDTLSIFALKYDPHIIVQGAEQERKQNVSEQVKKAREQKSEFKYPYVERPRDRTDQVDTGLWNIFDKNFWNRN